MEMFLFAVLMMFVASLLVYLLYVATTQGWTWGISYEHWQQAGAFQREVKSAYGNSWFDCYIRITRDKEPVKFCSYFALYSCLLLMIICVVVSLLFLNNLPA